MKAIICGSAFFSMGDLFDGFEKQEINTPFGNAVILKKDDLIILKRHGPDDSVMPHEINHKANIYALKSLSVSKIVSICNVGSLDENIRPADIVTAVDYINLWNNETIFSGEFEVIVPEMDKGIIDYLKGVSQKLFSIAKVGIYYQTKGPRLETKAEIRMIKEHADIIGMTMGTEATLSQESGIPYGAICFVDNYANGIINSDLDYDLHRDDSTKNEKLRKIFNELAGGL